MEFRDHGPHLYCSVEAEQETEPAGGGGGGGSAPTSSPDPAPPPASSDPAPDPAPDPEPEPPPEKPEAKPDESVEDVKARLAELEARDKAREKEIRKQRDAMRDSYLGDKLRVKEKYRQWAPDADPFTPDGQAKLREWAAEHPELLEQTAPRAPEFDPATAIGGDEKKRGILWNPDGWVEARQRLKRQARNG